jgi:hypothetical protein
MSWDKVGVGENTERRLFGKVCVEYRRLHHKKAGKKLAWYGRFFPLDNAVHESEIEIRTTPREQFTIWFKFSV